MAVTWSKDQQKIIDSRNQTLLVAAAAGSGKTAVLVERILSRISDEQEPVDIDHFLVVTFTNAAAAQMRERLDGAIEERLSTLDEKGKLYKRLKRQQMLLDNAQISTIHQFCLSIIRNHFNKLDIDPAFRVADEGELKLLKSDVVGELLESCYLEGDDAFYDLTESICTGKNDDALSEVILKLYEASVSHPDPGAWLEGVKRFYDINTVEEFEELSEVKYLLNYKENIMEGILKTWNAGLRAVLAENGPAAYEKVYNADKGIIDAIAAAKSYGGLVNAWTANSAGFIAMPRIKAGSADSNLQDEAKACRDTVKVEIKKLMDSYFVVPPEEILGQIRKLKGRAGFLVRLADEFAIRFKEKKREKNLVDFNDLEHFALEILLDKKDGVTRPSAAADEYSEYFCEIMVDEYQDSNMVQEAVISAVSGERFGRNNVFMVGDVKQSIYKFRMARPDLFLAKYDTFSREDGAPKQCIELSSNYRSRSQVLEGTNSIFEKIMSKQFGGIEYDDRSSLKCGMKFAEAADEDVYKAEILLADRTVEDKEKEDGTELEAKLIAGRIKELVSGKDGFAVWDKSIGEYRRCEYGDIVILLRSLTGRADAYVKILAEEGIPAYSQSGTGYFDAYEVQVMINFLRILNNPLNDIALAAVLHSPIGKLSSEELSLIRIADRTESIYEGIVKYDEGNEVLKAKLADFLGKYNKLRKMVPYMPLHKLIRTVLKVTGYDDFCMAMPAGEKRRMNLYMLVQKAVEFEGTSYKGLFNFVRYLDKLKKYEIDYGEASAAGEGNAVRIMTIHKSKGLEFPVVFLGGIGKRFNQQDAAEKIVIHADYGIGFDVIDTKRRTGEATFKRTILQRIIKTENLEEELRVLYVALTRAVEKLILVGSFGNLEDKLGKWRSAEADFLTLISAGSYADWIMPFSYKEFAAKIYKAEDVLSGEEKRQITESVKEEFLRLRDAEVSVDEAARKLIEERFGYKYSQAESIGVNAAVSVSELKRLSYVVEEEDESFLRAEEEVIIPKFMQRSDEEAGADKEERKDTGMQIGTAYHTVLWRFDFDNAPDRAAAISALIDGLKSRGTIEKAVADGVSVKRLLAFAKSELYNRMSKAHRLGLLKREQPFVLGMDAKEVREDWPEGEMILVQGVIDAFFEEDGELVVVDYKTDRVNDDDGEIVLVRRYKKQMELYAKALEQITGKKVKAKAIYSLGLGREVKL